MMVTVGFCCMLFMGFFSPCVSGCREEQQRFMPGDGCPADECFSEAAVDVIEVSRRVECLAACELHPTCESVIFNSSSDVKECRLHGDAASSNCTISTEGCIYMQLRDLLKTTDCPGNQTLDGDGQCVCSPPWMTGEQCDMYYKDCTAATEAGLTVPGDMEVMEIKPLEVDEPFWVKCYLNDGGYTYIMERNPSCHVDFMDREYDEYEMGFGDAVGCSFFLGLDKIQKMLMSETYNLDVDLVGDGFSGHAYYSKFFLKDASNGYEVSWDTFSSNDLEDGFIYGDNRNLLGARFRAEGDLDPTGCVQSEGTGWWYNADCNYVNLHLPLNATASELSTAGSASWPVGGMLKKIYSFNMKVANNG